MPKAFDAFDQNAQWKPVARAHDLTYGMVSDYFDVALNQVTHTPTFVILPKGEMPDGNNPAWSYLRRLPIAHAST